MNTFKKKSLCAALAGVGVLGVTGAAEAVNLNGNGHGQVLIYPFYTVRTDAAGNAFNSLISIVNSTVSVKSVKVRFLEAKNSQEVLDFNLFLSPKDVWTTAVIPSSTGGGAIITSDRSCTLPIISGQVNFVNFAYVGDGGGDGLDRTKDGYVEMIEMATYLPTSTTAANVTHSPPGGTPPGCAKETDALAQSEAQPPGGGLFGGITLINVNQGQSYQENAVALDNFSNVQVYGASGTINPTLTKASPPTSVVVANFSGALSFIQSNWPNGTANPVSAVLMHDSIMNEIVLDAATHSTTDWVITMPTKKYYIAFPATGPASPPFQRNFNGTSCDDITLGLWDREEFTPTSPLSFSPPPPTLTNSLCYEANVIQFGAVSPLASTQGQNLGPSLPATYQNGWLEMGFFPGTVASPVHTLSGAISNTITPQGGATFTAPTVTYFGLPTVGFAVQTFTNNTIVVNGVSVQSNYGGDFTHRYRVRITP